ncbi:MAG: hypothetical protein JXR07_08005 [Reichenbachiella sp.]
MNQTKTIMSNDIKWPEIFSLGSLSAAIAISWIAYHEYQPILLEDFDLYHLSNFLVISKGIILVITPPLAGLLADYLLKKNGKFFILFTVGIGATAMIFMVVASIIGAGPTSGIEPFLPYMIVLWLISMNLFVSPAYSMIESFAPIQKLPIVMGFIFMVTELIYALEPIVVLLVQFFGDTLTFVVGGILISGTGYLFHRISSNEVISRKKELIREISQPVSVGSYLTIIVIGLVLGLGKAILVEILPGLIANKFPAYEDSGSFIAFGLMGFAAILAFLLSRYVVKVGVEKTLIQSFVLLMIGSGLLFTSFNLWIAIGGGVIISVAFSLINISGLPFAISKLSVKHITYGVGVYLGASEIFGGIIEYINL